MNLFTATPVRTLQIVTTTTTITVAGKSIATLSGANNLKSSATLHQHLLAVEHHQQQHYHHHHHLQLKKCCILGQSRLCPSHQAEMAQDLKQQHPKPILRFGVVADVQYADSDDKQAWYNPAKTRFYRNSLKQVEKAFQHWEKVVEDNGKGSNCDSEQSEGGATPVSFILQLGDIIDKLNTEACSHTAIDRTLACFLNNPKMPTFHTVGNHELYNFDRAQMSYLFDKYLFEHSHSEHSFGVNNPKATSNLEGDTSHPLYYKFYPAGESSSLGTSVKFISLDTYDISVLGYPQSHPKFQLAASILEQHHGHRDPELWDTDATLTSEPSRRFQASNGALSEEQLAWLESELADSDAQAEVVVVFGHVGLHPASCGWDSLLWNYERVLELFSGHQCVVAYFSGHAHNAGYARDPASGIHYVVYHGVIETAPSEDCFATVSLYGDRLLVDGRGVEQSLVLPFTPPDRRRLLKLSSAADDNEEEEAVSSEDESSTKLEEQLPESSSSAVVQCRMEVEVEV